MFDGQQRAVYGPGHQEEHEPLPRTKEYQAKLKVEEEDSRGNRGVGAECGGTHL